VINAAGPLPVFTAKLLDRLARDADVQVILFDGGTPLVPTANLNALDVPDKIKQAVFLRDRSCRFPGCRRPIAHYHHINGRRGPNPHDPANLVGLCAQHHHHHVHRLGWKLEVNPDASVTWTRNGRSWTTIPRHTRLQRPDQPEPIRPPPSKPPRQPDPDDQPHRTDLPHDPSADDLPF
jgi:hypothetical protein